MVPAYFDVVRSIFYHRFQNFTGFGGKMTMSGPSKPGFACGDSGDCDSSPFSLPCPVLFKNKTGVGEQQSHLNKEEAE